GGVGSSGIGQYHGQKSFETFSHYKSIVNKSNRLDINVRYTPYNDKKEKMIKKLLH
ncbi:TPA: aldehyde dehydrogenase family protein, partial [Candidatus Avacholeplasma faecigallinarum]|nr:aldehyde dehydrogenase family protein [Candidatus Avacholeplasma faecigallinarum]